MLHAAHRAASAQRLGCILFLLRRSPKRISMMLFSMALFAVQRKEPGDLKHQRPPTEAEPS